MIIIRLSLSFAAVLDSDILEEDMAARQDSAFLRWFAELDSKYLKV